MLGSILRGETNDVTGIEDDSYDPDDIFETPPAPLEEFLYSPEYLNLSMRLSKPQLDFVSSLSDIFNDTQYTEGVLMAGQGSGKDT